MLEGERLGPADIRKIYGRFGKFRESMDTWSENAQNAENRHNPDDERGELYAALLQQASSMTPEDIIAEIARMKWILSSYDKEGG